MKRDDLKRFAPLPERTHALMMATARSVSEEEIVVKKKIPVALVFALVLVAFAMSALAIANTLGILDLLGHAGKSDMSEMIVTDIPQHGGDLEYARFEAREAIYDGSRVYFLIAASPKTEGTSFIHEMLVDDAEEMEKAKQFGQTVEGVYCEAAILSDGKLIEYEGGTLRGIGYGISREGATYVALFESKMPDGFSPDSITVEVDCAIKTPKGETIESSTLTFAIPKTVDASVQESKELEVSVEMRATLLQHISISCTPLEMRLAIDHIQADDKQSLTFALINPDDPEGKIIAFSEMSNAKDEKSNRYLFDGIFETDGSIPETIVLAIREAGIAAVINTATGDAALHPAEMYGGPGGDTIGLYYKVDYEITL